MRANYYIDVSLVCNFFLNETDQLIEIFMSKKEK